MATEKVKIKFETLEEAQDLTPYLTKSIQLDIARQVIDGYQIDEDSRKDWKDRMDLAMEIATQEIDAAPPDKSNCKFPLITMASIDFTSNALPVVLPNGNLVKFVIQGRDEQNTKLDRGKRVADFMNYQLLQKFEDWLDSTEILFTEVPVWGTTFKKTYYDPAKKKIRSEVCPPDKIVVNYGAMNLETVRRITHLRQFSANDIISNQRSGIFNKEIDPNSLRAMDIAFNETDFAIDLYEQDLWLDLDGDGYKEPYIATVHKETDSLLRLVNNFDYVERNDKNEIVCIERDLRYTDYHFLRSPDGGFYSIGYGALLLSINETINTLLNQLIDSGKWNNLQAGFIARGVRLKSGNIRLKMGEWQVLDAAPGATLAQSIVPIPTKEPSSTLYQLLGMLVQIGQDLSSTTDVMKGKQPAQNVATGTIDLLAEQGGKTYKAITTRLLRSLKKEYQKIYKLNYKYTKNSEYRYVLDDEKANIKKDFEPYTLDIFPSADPTFSSMIQRVTKAQILGNLPTIDRRAVDRYLLESMQLDPQEIEKLQPPADPNAPPPPEVQETMAKTQLYGAQAQQVMSAIGLDTNKLSLEMAKFKQQSMRDSWANHEAGARVWKMQKDALHNDEKTKITATKMLSEQELKKSNLGHQQQLDAINANLDSLKLGLDKHKTDTNAMVNLAKIKEDKKKNSNKEDKVDE